MTEVGGKIARKEKREGEIGIFLSQNNFKIQNNILKENKTLKTQRRYGKVVEPED